MANELELEMIDDYEEGEIFDEDNLYEDLSSSEELSNQIEVESCQKKKKEHECLENSLCRKERSGKQCHARLKKLAKTDDDDVRIVAVYPAPEKVKPNRIRKIDTSRDERQSNRYRTRKNSLGDKKGRLRLAKRKIVPNCSTNASLLKRLVGNGTIKYEKETRSSDTEVLKEEDIDERIHYLKAIIQPELSNAEKEDDSIELLKLRTEALKSAMCRRLAGKKINITRKTSIDDSITEHALKSIEEPITEDEIKPVIENMEIKTPKIKCLKEINPNSKLKKAKRNSRPIGSNSIMLKRRKKNVTRKALANKSNQQNDETEELRQLALMSVKNKIINNEMKPLTIKIESEKEIVSKSTPSSTDQWEDVDEDILRAQLLSEISDKIPMTETKDEKVDIKKINKENFKKAIDKKIAQNKRNNKILEKKNKTPIVDRFVICVTGDTSSDDDNENQKINTSIIDQIDSYLEQVRKEQEFERPSPDLVADNKSKIVNSLTASMDANSAKSATKNEILNAQDTISTQSSASLFKPTDKGPAIDSISPIKQEPIDNKVNEKAGNNSSAEAVTNLPVWQQEEYIRLTKKIAENELKRKAATANVAKKLKHELPVVPKRVADKLPEIKIEPDINIIKKQCKESWKHSEDFNEMSSMVDSIEKGLQNMNKIKNTLAQMKKELALEQNKYRNQKQSMLAMKDRLQDKRKLINDKIVSNFPKTEKESELVRLKFKELDLKAQIVCHNLTATTKPNIIRNENAKRKLKGKFSPLNKPNRVKRLRTKSDWDPFNPYCPYDMAGFCKDEDCKFQHNS